MTPQKSPAKKAPQILQMPSQNMAVMYTTGDPGKAAPEYLPALYGPTYKKSRKLSSSILVSQKETGLAH